MRYYVEFLLMLTTLSHIYTEYRYIRYVPLVLHIMQSCCSPKLHVNLQPTAMINLYYGSQMLTNRSTQREGVGRKIRTTT